MNFPCSSNVPCNTDDPFSNLTSENPDVPVSIGLFFPPVEPPLGQNWVATGCVGVCTSTVSQSDADLCAARQSAECQNTPPAQVPNPPPGSSLCNQT